MALVTHKPLLDLQRMVQKQITSNCVNKDIMVNVSEIIGELTEWPVVAERQQ